jgi:hypothetical protein
LVGHQIRGQRAVICERWQQPDGAAAPAQALPRALQTRIDHFGGKISKRQPPAPSREMEGGRQPSSQSASAKGCAQLSQLPAIRWKLQNLAKLKKSNPGKLKQQGEDLRARLADIHPERAH